MTKQEFLDKYGVYEGQLEYVNDFKMMVLSTLSDLQHTGNLSHIDNIKEFVMDYFSVTKNDSEIIWK